MKAIINTGPISAFDVNKEGAAHAAPVLGIWRYGVRVRGIKKRCRKSEWHVEGGQKGLGESSDFDDTLCKFLAERWIIENMKSYDQAFAMAYYWSIDQIGCETWEMFNDDHNKKIPLVIP